MKPKFQKYINFFAIALTSFLILGFLIILSCTIPFGEGLLKEALSNQLSSRLGQKVQIGSLETNLFTRLVIEELSAAGEEPGQKDELVSIKQIALYYQLITLVSGKFEVDSLIIDGLTLNAARDDSGIFSISVLNSGKQSTDTNRKSTEMPFSLRYAKLVNSNLKFNDQLKETRYEISNLDVLVTESSGHFLAVEIETDTLKLSQKNLNLVANHSHVIGNYDFNTIEISELELAFPGVEISAEGKLADILNQAIIEAKVEVKGNTHEMDQFNSLNLPGNYIPDQGFLQGTVVVSGNMKNPVVYYSVDGKNWEISGKQVKSIRIRGSYDEKLFDLDTLAIHAFGGSLIGNGHILLDSLKKFEIQSVVKSLNAVEVINLINKEIPIEKSVIDATLSSKGNLKEFTKTALAGSLKVKDIVIHGKKLKELDVKLHGKQEKWDATIQYESSSVRSSLAISEDKLLGDFTLDIVKLSSLALLLGIENLEGKLNSKGIINGTTASPEFQAEILGKNITYKNIPIDKIQGNISFTDNELSYNIQEAKGSGSIDLSLIHPEGQPLSLKKLDYVVFGSGTLATPYLSIAASYEDFTYPLSDTTIFSLDNGEFRVTLENRNLDLPFFTAKKDTQFINLLGNLDFSLKTLNLRMSVSGSDNLRKNFNVNDSSTETRSQGNIVSKMRLGLDYSNTDNLALNFTSDRLEIERVVALLPFEIPKLDGMVNSSIQFNGTLKHPNIRFRLSIVPFVANDIAFDSLKVSGELIEEHVRVNELTAYLKGFTNTIRAEVDFDRDSTGVLTISEDSKISGRATGKELSLALLKPLFTDSTIIEGEGSYDLILSGTRSKPRLNGRLVTSKGVFQLHPGSPTVSDIQVNVTLKDSLLQVRKLNATVHDRKLKARGSIIADAWNDFQTGFIVTMEKDTIFYSEGVFSRSDIDLSIEMEDLDISIFKPLIPTLEKLNGKLNADILVKGTPRNPDLNGKLSINSLLVKHRLIKSQLRNGSIKTTFDRNKIKLDTLIASIEKGKVGGRGVLSLSDKKISDYTSQVSLDNVSLTDPDNYEFTVGKGNLTIYKKDAGMMVEGELKLGQSKFTKDIDLAFLRNQMNRVQRPALDKPTFQEMISLNVRVHDNDRIGIENNLADIQLLTDVVVKGTASKPIVTGRVEVVKGKVYYLDREFRVTTGILDFVDPNRINPIIELTAETTVKSYFALEATEYHITLSISGPADDARIELISDPELDKSNIISLLTVGATRDQLTGASGVGTSTILQERAEMLASQKISNYVGIKISDKIGLDHVAVRGNLFNLNRDSGAQLEATKKVSEKLQLTYITRVGYLDENGLRLTYALSRYFALQGETHQTGDAGIDLRYNLKFK